MSIIPLGGGYIISYNLKKYNYYEKGYPFGFCYINIQDLLNILKNDFNYYENRSKKINKNILSNSNLVKLSKSILFQINNFRNLQNPVFIRIEPNILNKSKKKLYSELENILEQKFKNFKIVIISRVQIYGKNIEYIPLINNNLNNILWEEIFQKYKKK